MGIAEKRLLLPADAAKRYRGSGPEVDPDCGIYLRLGADKSVTAHVADRRINDHVSDTTVGTCPLAIDVVRDPSVQEVKIINDGSTFLTVCAHLICFPSITISRSASSLINCSGLKNSSGGFASAVVASP